MEILKLGGFIGGAIVMVASAFIVAGACAVASLVATILNAPKRDDK